MSFLKGILQKKYFLVFFKGVFGKENAIILFFQKLKKHDLRLTCGEKNTKVSRITRFLETFNSTFALLRQCHTVNYCVFYFFILLILGSTLMENEENYFRSQWGVSDT